MAIEDKEAEIGKIPAVIVVTVIGMTIIDRFSIDILKAVIRSCYSIHLWYEPHNIFGVGLGWVMH